MATYGLSEEIQERIAKDLYDAEKSMRPLPLPSREYPVLTLTDAYKVQRKGLDLRLKDGVRVVGHKIGITSEVMMKLLKCNVPDYGYLLAHTQLPEGGSCKRSELAKPLVEGELAFIIGEDLDHSPVTPEDVIRATSKVTSAFEICDTRYHSWDLTLRDVICDNGASALFMLSSATRPIEEIDPATISLVMEKNGEVIGRTTGADVMGSPVNSVTWLANKFLEYGDCLHAGDIVLSGSFLEANPALPGDVYTVTLEGFPPLTLTFE